MRTGLLLILTFLLAPVFGRSSAGNADLGTMPSLITGVGISSSSAQLSLNDKIAQATAQAREALAGTLRMRVTAQTSGMQRTTRHGKTDSVVDRYSSDIRTYIDIDMEGIETSVALDTARNCVRAVARLDIAMARSRYSDRLRRNLDQLMHIVRRCDSLIIAGALGEARLAATEGDAAAQGAQKSLEALEHLGHAPGTDVVSPIATLRDLDRTLWSRVAATPAEAAQWAVMRVRGRLRGVRGRVVVHDPTFGTGPGRSPLGEVIRTAVRNSLSEHTRLTPVRPEDHNEYRWADHGLPALIAQQYGADYRAEMTGVPGDSTIALYLEIIDTKTSGIVAAGQSRFRRISVRESDLLSTEWDPGGRPLDPYAGLTLDAWTNLGREGLILEKGDPLTISVVVNKPCFLRVGFSQPDGQYVVPDPLYVNYPIGEQLINRSIVLPDTFVVGGSCGVGVLHILVSEDTLESPCVECARPRVTGVRPTRRHGHEPPSPGTIERRIVVTVAPRTGRDVYSSRDISQ